MVKVKVKVGVKQLARVAGIDASRATEELQAFEALQEAGGLNSKNADAVDKAIVWGLISFWRQDQKRVGLVEKFKSKTHGNGIRAVRNIPEGKPIMLATGQFIFRDADMSPVWLFDCAASPEVGPNMDLDTAKRPNLMRFVNSAVGTLHQPSVEFLWDGVLLICYAKTYIPKGTELLADYQVAGVLDKAAAPVQQKAPRSSSSSSSSKATRRSKRLLEKAGCSKVVHGNRRSQRLARKRLASKQAML